MNNPQNSQRKICTEQVQETDQVLSSFEVRSSNPAIDTLPLEIVPGSGSFKIFRQLLMGWRSRDGIL